MKHFPTFVMLSIVLSSLLLSTARASDEEGAGQVLREMTRILNEIADTRESIKDKESAEAARDQLQRQVNRFDDTQRRRQNYQPSKYEEYRLGQQYGPDLVLAMKRNIKEQERINQQLGGVFVSDVSAGKSFLSQLEKSINGPPPAGMPGNTEKGSFAFLLPLLLFVIFIACVASLYTEGMWGTAIMLINVVTASLLAVNFFEPIARWMEARAPSYTFFWDFLALWGLFGLFLCVMRAVTDALSRTKIRFLKIVDQIGAGFFACWVGWVMVCFTAMSLHTAPLARNFMFGGFDPQDKTLFGPVGPDRQWLGFVQKVSRGTFCRKVNEDVTNKNTYQTARGDEKEKNLAVFDARGEFIPKYATRRTSLESYLIEHPRAHRVLEQDYGSDVPKR